MAKASEPHLVPACASAVLQACELQLQEHQSRIQSSLARVSEADESRPQQVLATVAGALAALQAADAQLGKWRHTLQGMQATAEACVDVTMEADLVGAVASVGAQAPVLGARLTATVAQAQEASQLLLQGAVEQVVGPLQSIVVPGLGMEQWHTFTPPQGMGRPCPGLALVSLATQAWARSAAGEQAAHAAQVCLHLADELAHSVGSLLQTVHPSRACVRRLESEVLCFTSSILHCVSAALGAAETLVDSPPCHRVVVSLQRLLLRTALVCGPAGAVAKCLATAATHTDTTAQDSPTVQPCRDIISAEEYMGPAPPPNAAVQWLLPAIVASDQSALPDAAQGGWSRLWELGLVRGEDKAELDPGHTSCRVHSLREGIALDTQQVWIRVLSWPGLQAMGAGEVGAAVSCRHELCDWAHPPLSSEEGEAAEELLAACASRGWVELAAAGAAGSREPVSMPAAPLP